MQHKTNEKFAGIMYGALAYGLWGILPIYWKVIKAVPAYEILAHRVVWSFVFVGIILVLTKGTNKLVHAVRDRKSLVFISISSVLIGINWFVYIWAVNSNHIVEASMGYYINPLMSVLLGTLVLKEKLDSLQYTALGIASVGVLLLAVQYGRIPWISLILAVSFTLYGLCKKTIKVDAGVGLALETAVLFPFALVFLIVKQVQGTAALGSISTGVTLLLVCAGAVTATPLLLFAMGAKRMELTTLGFLQYFSPTISLLLGIFVFKENFSATHAVCFGFIWSALLLYTISRLIVAKGLGTKNIRLKSAKS